MKLIETKIFNKVLQVLRSSAGIICGRRVRVIVVASRISDDTVAGLCEDRLLV